MAATRSPLSGRLRALANPRVIAIVVLAGVGALYLRRQHAQSAGNQLVGDTLPVDPSAATDPFAGTDLSSGIGLGAPEYHEPITLDPGQTVYDPTSGKFLTAPDVAAPAADTQVPDATGGQTSPAAPGNAIAALGAIAAGNWKRPKTATSHLPPGFDTSPVVRILNKAAIAKATQIAHLGRIGHDWHLPALAHPPSHSNVVRAATVVSGAAVRTAPRPRGTHRPGASPAVKRAYSAVHAGDHREGPAAAAPVRSKQPVTARVGRGAARSKLVSRPIARNHPAATPRREVVRAAVSKKPTKKAKKK